MKELICNYALIRFLPYRETGEFVNIGVVVYAPEVDYFGFKLTAMNHRRIRAFFPEMDQTVYRAAVGSVMQELERQRGRFSGIFGSTIATNENLAAFRALLRRKESLIHFAEPGMKLGLPEPTLQTLFDDYVMRKFAAHPIYQEKVMQNELRKWLNEWGLRSQYRKDQVIGDQLFHVTLPFVRYENEKPTAAIKPVDLNRDASTDVFEHGGRWIQRFRRLKLRGQLPARMVVPISFPTGIARDAADQIVTELGEVGVDAPDFADRALIRQLAQI
jgi:hypothetical protein